MFNKKLILIMALIVPLVACGGGGGGGGDDNGGGSNPPTDSGNGNNGNANPNAPVADAGDDQSVIAGFRVMLNGSASHDPNDDTLSYQWQFNPRPSNSEATLENADTPAPSFKSDAPGDYVVELTVNDGNNASDPDSVTVHATSANENTPPVAEAGRAQKVKTGDTVTLDGTASSDADGDTLAYNWELTNQPSGSQAQLDNASSAQPSFTADVAGTYTATLTVNDGDTGSDPDSVTITAANGNVAPVADAGDDRRVAAGNTVELDGTGSSDANGDSLSYAWHFVSRPQGSSASLQGATTATPSFTADAVGAYVVGLTVSDGDKTSASDQVLINSRPLLMLLLDLSSLSPNKQGFENVGLPFFQVYALRADPNQSSVTLNRYRLKAVGQNYTVTKLSTKLLGNSNCNTQVSPSFDGLDNGTVIQAGEQVDFSTRTTTADNGQCDLQFRFMIQETGDIFRAQDRVTFSQ